MIPELGNHILQSTIFAAGAGLLTLVLRNNHARTRYRIWLAASLKFLVPFSLLIGIGHRVSWPAAAVAPPPQVSVVVHRISQPFSPLPDYSPVTHNPGLPAMTETPSIMPSILVTVWLCGVCAVPIFWFLRWRRLTAIVRKARRTEEGPEWETLRKLSKAAAFETHVGLVIASRIEPSVLGIFRPVLLLPEGIAKNLDHAELDAIVAHELCHIRRRDNLTAALHMLVEAIFWFHPLSWWIGKKLVEERENACDEEVLTMGSVPEVYAESILKICRLCLESPLTCAAGVSGADLRKRIETIMTKIPFLTKLSPLGKAAIVAFGTLALVAPIVVGIVSAGIIRAQISPRIPAAAPEPRMIAQASPAPPPAANTVPPPVAGEKLPEFTTAEVRVSAPAAGRVVSDESVSGGHVEFNTITMRDLIRVAYEVGEEMVVGGPGWLAEDRFDVIALAPADSTQESQALMLRALLRDRFGLVVHNEKRPLPAFSMTVAKRGVQMKKSSGSGLVRCQTPPQERVYTAYACTNMTMAELAREIPGWGGTYFWATPVVDQSKLTGAWDFTLKWTPRPQTAATVAAGSEAISIFDAVDKQLGLKLELTKLPLDAIVVDRVNEKPLNPSGETEKVPAMPTQFEVGAVKPSDPASRRTGMANDPGGRVTVQGYTLQQLIALAWNIDPERIVNAPNFLDSDRFDITARAFADDGPSSARLLDPDSIRVMMRALLVERFKLAVHNEDRPEPAYVLTAGKPKMKTADTSNRSDCQNVPTPGGGPRPRMMTCQNTTMPEFVAQLMRFAPGYLNGTPVINETGVSGAWDITLNFSPAQMVRNNAADADPNGAISLFDAIDKELGLKLELQKRPMPVVVIDHVERKPTDN